MGLKGHIVNIGCGILVVLLTMAIDAVFVLPQLVTIDYANGFFHRHDLLDYAGLSDIVPVLIFGFLAAVVALKIATALTAHGNQMHLAIVSCVLVLVYAALSLAFAPQYQMLMALPGWLVGYPIGAGWDAMKRYS